MKRLYGDNKMTEATVGERIQIRVPENRFPWEFARLQNITSSVFIETDKIRYELLLNNGAYGSTELSSFIKAAQNKIDSPDIEGVSLVWKYAYSATDLREAVIFLKKEDILSIHS